MGWRGSFEDGTGWTPLKPALGRARGTRNASAMNATAHDTYHPAPDFPTAAFVKAPTVTIDPPGSAALIASAQTRAQCTLLLSAQACLSELSAMEYVDPSAVVTTREELLQVKGTDHAALDEGYKRNCRCFALSAPERTRVVKKESLVNERPR